MHSRHPGARAGRSAHLGAPEEARQKGLPDAHGPYAAGQVVCRGVGARASAPANWVLTYARAVPKYVRVRDGGGRLSLPGP